MTAVAWGMPRQDTPPQTPTEPPAAAESGQSQYEKAEKEIQDQERQRILDVLPNFNMTNKQDSAPLTAGQKFRLAFHSAVDPVQFVLAGLDAGLSQATNDFPGYGQGMQGYGKRVGAAYADQFSGTFWGNAIFPSMLHEDPRYFRKGEGSLTHRFLYSLATSFWTKNDDRSWGPNYANVLGNIAAGGLANVYYPPSDRGWELTAERAGTLTAEGALGAVFIEFWPDISDHVFHRNRNP